MPGAIVAGADSREQRRSRVTVRLAAATALLALVGALSVRTELWAVAALTALAIGLLAWTAEPHRARVRAWFAGLNAIILVAYLWGASELATLRVEDRSGQISASLGAAQLRTPPRTEPVTSVRVSVDAADGRPLGVAIDDLEPTWLRHSLSLLTRNLSAGLTDARLTTADGTPLAAHHGQVWQSDSRTEPPAVTGALDGWAVQRHRGQVVLDATVPVGSASAFSVDLVRPSSTVRVLIAHQGGRETTVVAAPDYRTFAIEAGVADQPTRTVAGGLFSYKRDALAWCQALARELLRPWLFALAILALVRLLPTDSPALGSAIRRARLSLPGATTAVVLGEVAVVATVPIAAIVLEGIPHVQDSVTYLFQAQLFALGMFAAPAPVLPEFFEQEFVLVHGGQWFGKYPPGQPLILAPGVILGAPWLVSPLAGGGAVALTYLAARRMYGPGVGLLSAVLLLTSPFFLFMSGDMMAHPAGLLWTSLLLYAVVRSTQDGPHFFWLVAGLAIGMLMITRQLTAVAIGAPLLLVLAAIWLRDRRSAPVRAALFLGGVGPPLAFLLYFNWRLLGDPLRNPFELWWTFDRIGFGAEVGMHGGHDLANGLANTWANSTELLRHLFGWPPYLTLAFAVVPFITPARNRWDPVLGATAMTLIAAYIFYWADGIMYGPRYYYEAIGVLSILTARGVALLASSTFSPGASGLVGGEDPPREGGSHVTIALLLSVLLAVNLASYLPAAIRTHRGYNGISRAALDLVQQANVGRALVFVTQRWPDWQPYGSVFPANGPLLDGRVVYARDLGAAENARLRAIFPDRTAYLLRDLQLSPLPP